MKIGLYVPAWPPGSVANGVVTYASQLVPALRHIGHQVFIITPVLTESTNDRYTVDLRKFVPKPVFWRRAAYKVAPHLSFLRESSHVISSAVEFLVREESLEIVQIEDSFGWSLTTSERNRVPVVVRLHGPWFLNGQFDNSWGNARTSRIRIRREGLAIKAATAITAPSQNVLQLTQHYYGQLHRPSRVIPNPINPVSNENVWNLARTDRNSILFVGRFDRHKGADVLLSAFTTLAREFSSLRLTFIGPDVGITAPNTSVRRFDEYVKATVPESVRQRITYLGKLDHPEVRSLRPKFFITVVPSRYETFSNTVLEAMAAGCPIVATSAGAIPELIQHNRNGLLVRPEDADDLAAACRTLLYEHETAERLGGQALHDSRDRHDPTQVANDTIALYEKAIETYSVSG